MMKSVKAFVVFGVCVILAGCGSRGTSVAGEYGAVEDGGWLTIFDFKGAGRVVITMVGDSPVEGRYEVEENRLIMTGANDTHTFTVRDDGCFDAGLFYGTVCPKP